MKTREINPARLIALRGKRSREVVAHELRRRGHGTDAKSIWRYETGKNQPSARILADLADVLGARTVEELYSEDEEEEAAPSRSLATDLQQLATLAVLLERNPHLIKELA